MKRLLKRLIALWRYAESGAAERVYGYEAAWPVLQAIPVQALSLEACAAVRKETEAQTEAR